MAIFAAIIWGLREGPFGAPIVALQVMALFIGIPFFCGYSIDGILPWQNRRPCLEDTKAFEAASFTVSAALLAISVALLVAGVFLAPHPLPAPN